MKKILLFGAGNLLEKTIKCLKKDVEISAIIDNDVNKWGTKYKNISIVSPDEIDNYDYNVIIISNDNYCHQIRKQLKEKNINRVLPIYSSNISLKQKKIMSKYFSISGMMYIYLKNEIKVQQFFPKKIGACVNPYYFSRKNIWYNLEKYKKYINGRCMDFGCGSKPYSKMFKTTQYIGVEIETDIKKDDIVYYDGKHIPFNDESFDSILCSEVLEHIPNIEEIIAELHRVLVIDGYMVVTVPFSYPEHCKPYDYRRYTSIGICALFEKKGFKVIDYCKSGSFVNTISQMRAVYINEKMPNVGILKYMKKIMIVINNVVGIIENKLLPFDNDLFLDNVIVLKKNSNHNNR